jgi:hypothetical protein
MTYTDKVKASRGIVEAIKALGNDEYIIVRYGKDYNGQPMEFKVRCSVWRDKPSYSIHRNEKLSLDGMNISSLNKTTMKAYTYDMMSQKTTYTFPLYEMTIVEEPFKEQLHDLKF